MLKRFIIVLLVLGLAFSLIGCTNGKKKEPGRTVTDMMGREIELPEEINTIFCIEPMSAITLYTVAPQKLAGWSYKFNDYEAQFILEEYRDLPVYGRGGSINYEAVLAAEPDIALLTGTLGDGLVDQAETFAEKLGVPVVILDNKLTEAPAVYTLLGEVTGKTEHAKALSDYAANVLGSVTEPDEKVTIYYANGVASLDTSAKGTAASQLFDMVYAENVCELSSESGDRITVTKEHVIDWNAEYIFVNGEPSQGITGSTAAKEILDDPQYENVQAVKDGNVISVPKAPFAWVDRPRSINLLIGIPWLGSVLYPDNYTFTNDDIKEFYSLFYHLELTDEQVNELLSQ